ncbi:carbohydrate sulfotransferase 9-like isoform X1 [Argopecten irradians]|uniref:carbohydrate sulfotransferase 9-like isoform X1 n=2 Tax=Argopecten irradians TaxID=31199 RepID=UPI00370F8B29
MFKFTVTCLLVSLSCVTIVFMWYITTAYDFKISHDSRKMYESNNVYKMYGGSNVQVHQPETDVAVEKAIPQRLSRIRAVCKSKIGKHYISKYKTHTKTFFYSKKLRFACCKAPKTGSTLWGAIFTALESPLDVDAIFQLSRIELHYGTYEYGAGLIAGRMRKQGVPPLLTTMVARNPYTRLFSAYIDKLFLLGAINRMFGLKLKTGFAMIDYQRCGYQVSFVEFLSRLAELGIKRGEFDEHWSPIYRICDPCSFQYNVVSKQETLTRDADFTLDKIQMKTERKNSIKKILHSDGLYANTIFSLISSLLAEYRLYSTDCPDRFVFLKKVWKSLQMQGHVHEQSRFPLEAFKNLTDLNDPEMVTSVIMQNLDTIPVSEEQRVLQRRNVLVNAYRTVSPDVLNDIKDIYKLDFLMFGYSENPPS